MRRAREQSKAAAGRISSVNYEEYSFSRQEKWKSIGIFLLLDGGISFLFYNSFIPFFLLLPGLYLYFPERKKSLQKKRIKQMKTQFLDGMQSMVTALQAGYAVENALREALKELKKVYREDDFIIREFSMMDRKMSMNQNMEDLFLDFGRRSAIDDIRSFAEVFVTAKRSGGDLMSIINNTINCIRQKEETLQEIETCISGKAMEQNVMSVIPMFIIAYVRVSSPDFIARLYGNILGVLIMSACLGVYAFAYLWGKKIVSIEV